MQKLFEIRIKFFLHNEKFNAVEYRQMDRQIEKQIDRQKERVKARIIELDRIIKNFFMQI